MCSTATRVARAPDRRRRFRRSCRGRGRDGDRRLDRLPIGREWHRRNQADARPPQPRRRRPDQRRPGHRRADGPQRDRCGRPPWRDDREDADDPATPGQAGKAFTDYTPFLDDEALDGATIGVRQEGTVRARRSAVPTSTPIMDDAIAALESQGATVVEVDADSRRCLRPRFDALLCEFKTDIATYLETYTGRGLPEVARRPDRVQRGQPEDRGRPGQRASRGTTQIFEAAGTRAAAIADMCRAPCCGDPRPAGAAGRRDGGGSDAIIAPTNGPAWVTDPVNGDLGGDFSTFVGSSSASAITGWADITVPAGYVDRALPIGVTFIGGHGTSRTSSAMPTTSSRRSQVRVPPSVPEEAAIEGLTPRAHSASSSPGGTITPGPFCARRVSED